MCDVKKPVIWQWIDFVSDIPTGPALLGRQTASAFDVQSPAELRRWGARRVKARLMRVGIYREVVALDKESESEADECGYLPRGCCLE